MSYMGDLMHKQLVEAAIFALAKPLSIAFLQNTVLAPYKLNKRSVSEILASLQQDYQDKGIVLLETASGFSFVTRASLSDSLNCLWQEKSPKYSKALLETLAIVAYRQPITRGEIEHIRGVAVSSHIMKTLVERDWVKIVGQKDVAGKPSLYGTNKEFLDYFGLSNLSQLPLLEENKLDAAISAFEQL